MSSICYIHGAGGADGRLRPQPGLVVKVCCCWVCKAASDGCFLLFSLVDLDALVPQLVLGLGNLGEEALVRLGRVVEAEEAEAE